MEVAPILVGIKTIEIFKVGWEATGKPSPVEDIYILSNAILLDADNAVLLADDGTPIVYN